MRKSLKKITPRITNFKCFKQFSNEAFRETLTNNVYSEELGLQRFCKACIETVDNKTKIDSQESNVLYGKRSFRRNHDKVQIENQFFKK